METYMNIPTDDKAEMYRLLCRQFDALCEGVASSLSNMANLSSLLYHTLPCVNWAGFYLLRGSELLLGPFHGKPACVKILLGHGVCGTAAETRQIQLVPNVHLFPGHIACDSASASEVVLPLMQDDTLYGVLDLDSPEENRFDEADALGLSMLADILLKHSTFRKGLLA